MYTYKIEGQVNFNDAETEDGNLTIEISEIVEVGEMSADAAKTKFFAENQQYDDFFGGMKICDQETRGGKGATYKDDEGRVLEVDLEKQ